MSDNIKILNKNVNFDKLTLAKFGKFREDIMYNGTVYDIYKCELRKQDECDKFLEDNDGIIMSYTNFNTNSTIISQYGSLPAPESVATLGLPATPSPSPSSAAAQATSQEASTSSVETSSAPQEVLTATGATTPGETTSSATSLASAATPESATTSQEESATQATAQTTIATSEEASSAATPLALGLDETSALSNSASPELGIRVLNPNILPNLNKPKPLLPLSPLPSRSLKKKKYKRSTESLKAQNGGKKTGGMKKIGRGKFVRNTESKF